MKTKLNSAMYTFKCPKCGSSHFGSTIRSHGLLRRCHGKNCRFEWEEKDDNKYSVLRREVLEKQLEDIKSQCIEAFYDLEKAGYEVSGFVELDKLRKMVTE